MPSTPDLSGEHPIHLVVVQGLQRGGADLACGVHDAGQRRQFGLHRGQQARDVVRVGNISRGGADIAVVLFAQRVDALLSGIAR